MNELPSVTLRGAPTSRLIYLHGAPAVGKLTIARELVTLTGARLFDNHVAIDLALSVFDFGEDGFWDLVIASRLEAYRAAARARIPLLITTNAYNHPEDLPDFELYEATVESAGGIILPVHFSCSKGELMTRVTNPARAARGKISNVERLQDTLSRKTYAPIPRPECLSLDTERSSAPELAKEVVRHFGLSKVSDA